MVGRNYMRDRKARLMRRLDSVTEVGPREREALEDLAIRVGSLAPGQDVIRAYQPPQECCVVFEGILHRYQLLPDGSRQILAFHVPGDIPDLQSLGLGVMDHSVAASVACTVGYFSHADINRLIERHPGVAKLLWRVSLIEAAGLRAWLTSMGRRPAVAHVAHLVCELFVRLRAVGLTTGMRCSLPLTQTHFADALGLSLVQVNRSLNALRRKGLFELSRGQLVIHDWPGLKSMAGFDPAYLHLRKEWSLG